MIKTEVSVRVNVGRIGKAFVRCAEQSVKGEFNHCLWILLGSEMFDILLWKF